MKTKAFTLIELLVVVAIIGILAAVGVVAYNGYTKAAKKAATKKQFYTYVNFIKSTLAECYLGNDYVKLMKKEPVRQIPDKKYYNFDCNNHSMNNDKNIKNIVNNYFSKISYIKTSKNIILDKNPLNFQWLGFIRILFPNAKIIHCSRNLKDTALSIYKNDFDINSILWSNWQEDLVQYISIYLNLMKFWEKKIPNFIYNLNYEKLINNPKEQTEKLLNFCELNWEENCLNYNKKPTAIETVSATQARKPIYKTSQNSYKKYYNYLDMFKKIEELEKA